MGALLEKYHSYQKRLVEVLDQMEGFDYTFTWGDGVGWEESYDAVAGDGILTIQDTWKEGFWPSFCVPQTQLFTEKPA